QCGGLGTSHRLQGSVIWFGNFWSAFRLLQGGCWVSSRVKRGTCCIFSGPVWSFRPRRHGLACRDADLLKIYAGKKSQAASKLMHPTPDAARLTSAYFLIGPADRVVASYSGLQQ